MRRSRSKPYTSRPASTREGEAADGSLTEDRRQHEGARVQRTRFALERERGALVDRQKAANLVFALAREERDSWLNWPPHVAAMMAAELGVDSHAML
jgi:hypothetical protein